MALLFPCELICWNFLPAVRKELVSYMVKEKHLSRKAVAEAIGLTQASICHYLSNKRGNKFNFSSKELKKIHEMAEKLIKSSAPGQEFISETCCLCKEARKRLVLCEMHRAENPELGNCKACREARK